MTEMCGRTSIIDSPASEARRAALIGLRKAPSPKKLFQDPIGAVENTASAIGFESTSNLQDECRAVLLERQCRAVHHVRSALAGEPDIECRVSHSREELFAAFSLVYHQYRRAGLMNSNMFQMRITPYHLLPTTEVIVALDGKRVTCTMSLVCDGEKGLPMETVYPEEIAQLRSKRCSLAEVSCLAEWRDDADQSPSAVFQLMPLMAQLAYRRGADFLMIAVHPRHSRFYRRVLGFDAIAEERKYGKVCGKPAVAMSADLNRLAIDHPRVHQWMFGEPFPHSVLAYKRLSSNLLAEMEMISATCSFNDAAHDVRLIENAA